ncbi:MAG: universal stress protein [Salinivenus sp.]
MYNHILYPTDGSPGAGAALAHCQHLAQAFGATVHVLYVAERLGPHGLGGDVEVKKQQGMVGDPKGGESGMVGDRKKRREVRADIKAYASSLVESVDDQFEDVETRTEVKEGTPYKVILDYAETHDIDLILMGTHGRTGFERYLIGSVTEKVVRMSDVPVLTVRQAET